VDALVFAGLSASTLTIGHLVMQDADG